ncbi:hypothetical protein GGX14DRAFT_384419 [Mycena pura]|uniref:Uncharacterized protein n=1 Tax=Mycena pura TaxID=153505 RepID=A0AAD7E5Y5_9AGAR|nr:hypothetical protein GGX14DRAFT_384419 [Mycena pura]
MPLEVSRRTLANSRALHWQVSQCLAFLLANSHRFYRKVLSYTVHFGHYWRRRDQRLSGRWQRNSCVVPCMGLATVAVVIAVAAVRSGAPHTAYGPPQHGTVPECMPDHTRVRAHTRRDTCRARARHPRLPCYDTRTHPRVRAHAPATATAHAPAPTPATTPVRPRAHRRMHEQVLVRVRACTAGQGRERVGASMARMQPRWRHKRRSRACAPMLGARRARVGLHGWGQGPAGRGKRGTHAAPLAPEMSRARASARPQCWCGRGVRVHAPSLMLQRRRGKPGGPGQAHGVRAHAEGGTGSGCVAGVFMHSA